MRGRVVPQFDLRPNCIKKSVDEYTDSTCSRQLVFLTASDLLTKFRHLIDHIINCPVGWNIESRAYLATSFFGDKNRSDNLSSYWVGRSVSFPYRVDGLMSRWIVERMCK